MSYFWQNPGFGTSRKPYLIRFQIHGKKRQWERFYPSLAEARVDAPRVLAQEFPDGRGGSEAKILGVRVFTKAEEKGLLEGWNPGSRRTNPSDLTVANTILSQMGGTGRLSAMIGAHSFVGDENSVSFRFKARARNGANAFHVTLDPSDTYTIKFLKIRKLEVKTVKELDDVYAEDLKRIFEDETGLRLSL